MSIRALFAVRSPEKRCQDILAEMKQIHEEYSCLELMLRNQSSRSCCSSMERRGKEDDAKVPAKLRNKSLTTSQIKARQTKLTVEHQRLQGEYAECTKRLREQGKPVPTIRFGTL